MALDPTILVAIASASIGTVITGLFAVWQKYQDNKAKANDNKTALATAMIKIKTEGLEVEIPQGISTERFDEIMKTINKHKTKSIALITEL
jgi:hypothetical protein